MMSKKKIHYYKTKILHGEEHHTIGDYIILGIGIICLLGGLILLADIIVGIILLLLGLFLIHLFRR